MQLRWVCQLVSYIVRDEWYNWVYVLMSLTSWEQKKKIVFTNHINHNYTILSMIFLLTKQERKIIILRLQLQIQYSENFPQCCVKWNTEICMVFCHSVKISHVFIASESTSIHRLWMNRESKIQSHISSTFEKLLKRKPNNWKYFASTHSIL